MMMTLEALIETLMRHGSFSFGEATPRQSLYVSFGGIDRKADDTLIYTAVDETRVALDIDGEGKVIGIELL